MFPATASLELVQSLSTCRHLTELNLFTKNKLGEAGHQLAQSIRSWGDEPPLQKLYLHNCSLPATASLELVQSLSTCRHLTELSLGENDLIWSWTSTCTINQILGRWTILQELYLSRMFTSSYCITWTCTISVNMQASHCIGFRRKWFKVKLDINLHSQSDPGEMNHHYRNSICKCSLPATASLELVQSLSTCRHLTELIFGRKQIRWSWTSTCTVNQILGRWTTTTKTISVHNCSLPATASLELLQSLSTCRHLTELNLGENDLNEAGHQLAQSIRSWGDDPPLQELYLSKCSLPATASLELVQSLSTCRHLTELNLGENDLRWSWTSTCTVNQILGRWTTITETLSVQLFTFSYCITWTCTISVNMQHLTDWFRKKQIRWSWTSTCTVNQILGRWTTTTKTLSPQLFTSSYCITWTCTISVNM